MSEGVSKWAKEIFQRRREEWEKKMLPSIRLPLPQPPPAAGGVRAMFGIILHVFLFSSTTSQALDWLGPRPTPTQSSLPDIQGWTPKPTDAPRLPHQQHHHAALANTNLELKRLFRRQAQSKYPNTCGYVDGNEYYSFTCSGAYACAYHVDNFAFGCKSLFFLLLLIFPQDGRCVHVCAWIFKRPQLLGALWMFAIEREGENERFC